MKKVFVLMLVAAMTASILSSCSKVSDDYYFPKVKISSVLNSDGEGTIINYDGKYISTIIMDDEIFDVSYNGDDQISEMNNVAENSKVLLFYTDKKIERIEYYSNGVMYYYQQFTHNTDGTIASVSSFGNTTGVDWMKVCQDKLFAAVFDTKPILDMVSRSAKSDLQFMGNTHWTFADGNVKTTSMTYEYGGMSMSYMTVYEYDENKNPMYGLPYALGGVSVYSKNNPVKVMSTMSMDAQTQSSELITVTYTYNSNKYPQTATIKMGNDTEISTYTYTK